MLRDSWNVGKWSDPPIRCCICVRKSDKQTTVPGFPIPIFTTILELRLILSFYFFNGPAAHVFYGDLRDRKNLAFENEGMLVSHLIGKDSDPHFTIIPFKNPEEVMSKLEKQDRENTLRLTKLDFKSQMEHLLKSLPKNGARAQGIRQLVNAMGEGHFRHIDLDTGFVLL